MTQCESIPPMVTFKKAIKEGRLSKNPKDSNYAGNYMFMGRWNGKDEFKHHETRLYLK